MNYTRLIINVSPLSPGRELVVALLDGLGYESFIDTELGVEAYIQSPTFDLEAAKEALDLKTLDIQLEAVEVPHENWNQKWEDSFKSVLIADNCIVRAPFHEADPSVEFDLVIQPQMSFGTGHHPTTELMLEFLLEHDLQDKKLLDVGSGTGVLAILAEKKGAVDIVATDIEDYILENARENIRHNKCVHIDVEKAGLQTLVPEHYDVTLANINLNALLAEMQGLATGLKTGGLLFLSGFYEPDAEKLVEEARRWNVHFAEMKIKDHWTALKLLKS